MLFVKNYEWRANQPEDEYLKTIVKVVMYEVIIDFSDDHESWIMKMKREAWSWYVDGWLDDDQMIDDVQSINSPIANTTDDSCKLVHLKFIY